MSFYTLRDGPLKSFLLIFSLCIAESPCILASDDTVSLPYADSSPLASKNIDSLLESLCNDMGTDSCENLVSVFNYSGSVKFLWKEHGIITTTAMNSESPLYEDIALNFIIKYSELLGVKQPSEDLMLSSVLDRSGTTGLVAVSFSQYTRGYPVFSSEITIEIDSRTRIVSGVVSSLVENLFTLESSFPVVPDYESLLDSLSLSLGSDLLGLGDVRQIFYIDKDSHSLLAVPAIAASFTTVDGMSFRGVFDASCYEILSLESLDRNYSTEILTSNTRALAHSDDSCLLWPCPPQYSCIAHNCVLTLASSSGSVFYRTQNPYGATNTQILYRDGSVPRRTNFYGRY